MLESLSVVNWVSISLNQVKSIECIVLFGMNNYKKQKLAAVVPNLLHHIMICYTIMQFTIMQLIIMGWHSRWAVCRRLDLCIENRPAGAREEKKRERERERANGRQAVCRCLDLCIQNRPAGGQSLVFSACTYLYWCRIRGHLLNRAVRCMKFLEDLKI